MPLPKILVTGATGKTGAAVVDQLLAKGYPVRASVRVRDARSADLERRGAEVVVADLFDPDQLRDAMVGVQRGYYVPPFHPYAIQSAVAFAVAAQEAPARIDRATQPMDLPSVSPVGPDTPDVADGSGFRATARDHPHNRQPRHVRRQPSCG